MEPSSPTVTTPVEDVVLVVLPSRIAISRGVEHSGTTRAQVLLTYPSRDPVNQLFFAQVFCWYTSFSVSRLRMVDAVSMELSSIIFVRTNYSATIGLLNISDDDDDDYDDEDDYDDDDDDYDDDDDDDDDDNDEDNNDDDDEDEDDYFDLDIDDDYHAYFDRGSRPASAAAVEGLKMVTAEEPDSCSICLEDLGMAAPVLTMPCSHLFHPGCLKKWLELNCSCPLCRFSLPQEQ